MRNLLFVIFVSLIAGQSVEAATAEANSPVKLAAVLLTAEPMAGGALDVAPVVENRSDKAFVMVNHGGMDDYEVTATYGDDSAVQKTARMRAREEQPGRGGLALNQTSLEPGKKVGAVLRLSEYFDVSTPGDYVFRISRNGIGTTIFKQIAVETVLKVRVGPVVFANESAEASRLAVLLKEDAGNHDKAPNAKP